MPRIQMICPFIVSIHFNHALNEKNEQLTWAIGVPTLLYTTDSGSTYEPVPVSRFSAYYNLGETQAEVAIPQNLKLVAGDSSATTASASPSDAKVSWFYEGDNSIAVDANGFPSSTCSTHLQTLLYFPQCVNNGTLETAYKSKSYGTTNYCPNGYSSMAQLRFSIRYDLRKALPNGWSGTAPLKLACGNSYCSVSILSSLVLSSESGSLHLTLPLSLPILPLKMHTDTKKAWRLYQRLDRGSSHEYDRNHGRQTDVFVCRRKLGKVRRHDELHTSGCRPR